jgi:hypothetical protein
MTEYEWNEIWLGQRHWELAAESLNHEQGVWSIVFLSQRCVTPAAGIR